MARQFQFPSLLSYCGSIKPSIGFFYALNGQEKRPVKINEESTRGTKANYAADKKEKNVGGPNLQQIDRAYLPANYSQCNIEFTLNFLPNALKPHACNELESQQMLIALTNLYKEKGGFDYLAAAYAENIINGRWLWRNKSLTETIAITVKLAGKTLKFTLTRNVDKESIQAEPDNGKALLTGFIADALSGKSASGLMSVSALFDVGAGQEVYPSQELPLDGEDKRGNSEFKKSRILAQMDEQAILHSQKIGNAIRTIDVWYPNADASHPLAIEPFGVDSVLQTALRADSRSSFYALLEKNYFAYLEALKACDDAAQLSGESEQIHFVIACLIRGGVYSGEKKEKGKAKE